MRPYLEKTYHKKRAGGMVHGIGTKKKKRRRTKIKTIWETTLRLP
jgi:hypothetical protein